MHPATASPESSTRRLSEDHGSIVAPNRIAYQPAQPSNSATIQYPISADELASLRADAYHNNPLRRRGRRTVPPSWSAPSPRNSVSSLEPVNEYEAGPSYSGGPPSRRGSTASATADIRPPPPPREDSWSNKRGLDEAVYDDRSAPRRRTDNYTGKAAEVASHYNMRPDVGVEHREYSPIIGLKKFNNWVKSVLIGKFAFRERGQPGAKVMDIGCGKGGDLMKWKQARIELYVAMGAYFLLLFICLLQS